MEAIQKITTNTLIPISLVLSIGLGVWSLATMNAKISANQLAIAEIKIQCSANPSRNEFQQMREDLNEIKGDIKKLISK